MVRSFFPSFPVHPSIFLFYTHHILLLSSLHVNTVHFNLLSCTFLNSSPTFVVPLIIPFLIVSSLVTLLIHLNILISTANNFFSCAFFTSTLQRLMYIKKQMPQYFEDISCWGPHVSKTCKYLLTQNRNIIPYYSNSPHNYSHMDPISKDKTPQDEPFGKAI